MDMGPKYYNFVKTSYDFSQTKKTQKIEKLTFSCFTQFSSREKSHAEVT